VTNSVFSGNYNKFKKKEKEDKVKKPYDKDDMFGSLYKRYRSKNYSIDKLHIKTNLFKPDVVLMSRDSIERQFKFKKEEVRKLNNKLKFLHTVEDKVIDKISAEQLKILRMDTYSIFPRKKINMKSVVEKSSQQLKKEINTNVLENGQLKDTIKEMNFRAGRSMSMMFDPRKLKLQGTVKFFTANSYKQSTTMMDTSAGKKQTGDFSKQLSSTIHNNSAEKKYSVKDTMRQSKEIKFKILQQACNSKNQSTTNTTQITTIDSNPISNLSTARHTTVRSFIRKPTKHETERNDKLHSLYTQISKQDGFDENAKDAVTSYLKTFTEFLRKYIYGLNL
jgi:hypothetical protein